MKEMYELSNFDGLRVIKADNEIYAQREYMVPGNEEDGTYNPCIKTEWRTLIEKLGSLETARYEILNLPRPYRIFNSIEELIQHYISAESNEVLYSSMYERTENIGEAKVIATEDSIREDYAEYLI